MGSAKPVGHRSFALVVVVAAVAFAGCGSDTTASHGSDADMISGVHPSGTVSTPTEHRASPMACAPAPGSTGCTGSGSCSVDADCTAGPNGRCYGGGIVLCSCSYEDCKSDSDCSAGQDCACHLTLRGAPSGGGPNTCVPANCRSDADCASGFCSPSYKADYCESYVDGYYCHTPDDECGVNADCVADAAEYAVCAYDSTLGHWACIAGPFCAG